MTRSSQPRLKFRAPARALWAGLAALLLGCTRPELLFPDLPPIDPLAAPVYGMAQVCILRPHTWAMAHIVLFEDNGHLVGATRGPSYFCYAAQPGAHRIRPLDSGRKPTLDLQVAAGQRIFVHHRVGLATDRLTLIPEAEAPELLDKCEYSQLTDTPAHAVYSESPALPAL